MAGRVRRRRGVFARVRPPLDILNAAVVDPSTLLEPERAWLAEHFPDIAAGLASWTPPEFDPDPRLEALRQGAPIAHHPKETQ